MSAELGPFTLPMHAEHQTVGDSMNCQRRENLMFPDWSVDWGGGHPAGR